MQAELIFYKNELAKLCLRTGSKFPVFRATVANDAAPTSSWMDASQILAKRSSNSYNASE